MRRQTASRASGVTPLDLPLCLAGPAALWLLLFFLWPAHAQESLRLSLAGADAARARREAAAGLADSNLKLGPTVWTFGSALGLQAMDNIRLESSHARADLIVQPELDARMACRLSELNTLSFGVGAGYSAYALHPAFDRFFVAPGSELSLDLYAGDFWVNVHDRVSITENAYQDPTVVGAGDYSQLANSVGETTTWDLNKAMLKLGYEHVDYLWLQAAETPGRQPSGVAEVFSGSAGYNFRPGLSIGVEAGGSLFHYTSVGRLFTDATEWNVGGFADAQLTSYIHGRLSAGYTVYTPELPAPFRSGLQFSGIYAQGDLAHRLNQFLTYTLTAARTVNFAFYGGTVDLYLVRCQAEWKLFRRVMLGTWFEYQHGTELSFSRERFERFGPGVSLSHPFSHKMTASLVYQFYDRCSDLAGREYAVNIVALNLTYKL